MCYDGHPFLLSYQTLGKFRAQANVILSENDKQALSVEDALKIIREHNFDVERALEAIRNPRLAWVSTNTYALSVNVPSQAWCYAFLVDCMVFRGNIEWYLGGGGGY